MYELEENHIEDSGYMRASTSYYLIDDKNNYLAEFQDKELCMRVVRLLNEEFIGG